jgi:WD40 repeat protein
VECFDRSVRVFDSVTRKLTTSIEVEPGHVGARWHPKGETLFGGTESGRTIEWDANSGAQRRVLSAGEPFSSDVEVSPDGTLVARARGHGIAVWELASGRRRSVDLGASYLTRLTFSPDSRTLASGADDGQVRLVDLMTLAPRLPPLAHPGSIRSIDFSPDGRRLVVACDAGEARIWEAATGRLLTPPLRPAGGVAFADFSPDGRMVATSDNYTAQVWDARLGVPVTPLFRHDRELVGGAAFGADSRAVCFVTAEGRLYRYDLTVPEWTDDDRQFAARMLSGFTVSEDGGLLAWRPTPAQPTAVDVAAAARAWASLRNRLDQLR